MYGRKLIYLSLPANRSIFLLHFTFSMLNRVVNKFSQKLFSIFSSLLGQLQKWPLLSPYMTTREPYKKTQLNFIYASFTKKRHQPLTNKEDNLELPSTNKNYIHEIFKSKLNSENISGMSTLICLAMEAAKRQAKHSCFVLQLVSCTSSSGIRGREGCCHRG